MKFHLLFAVFCLTSFCCGAQLPQWQLLATRGGTFNETGSNCLLDGQGNIYVASSIGQSAGLTKFRLDGSTVWTRKITGDQYVSPPCIKLDHSGNLVIAGRFYTDLWIDTFRLRSGNLHNTYVAKLDTSGQVLWVRAAPGRMDVDGMGLDDADRIYINGMFDGRYPFNANDDTTGLSSMLVPRDAIDAVFYKLDTDGRLIWLKQLKGSSSYGLGLAIRSNQVFLSGMFSGGTMVYDQDSITYPAGLPRDTSRNTDIYLASCDTAGKLLWLRSLGGKKEDQGITVTTDQWNNVYLVGMFTDSAVFGQQYLVNRKSRYGGTPFIAKFDKNGNLKWAQSFNGKNELYDKAGYVATDKHGNVYATGHSGDSTLIGSTLLRRGGLFIAKWDSSGILQWATNDDLINFDGMCLDEDDHLYATGSYLAGANFNGSVPPAVVSNSNFFLARLVQPTAISFLPASGPQVSVFPNPTSGLLSVSFAQGAFSSLKILDMQGRIVLQKPILSNASGAAVQLPELPKGVYLLQLTGNQQTATRKIVLQ